jgi:hypothetical protein
MEAMPQSWRSWIEDPWLTPETDEVLRPDRERITWDAPIHSVADVDALPIGASARTRRQIDTTT